ncbi:MAG: class I SAM-dependent methyltransferase [Thermoplasmata archaeon]
MGDPREGEREASEIDCPTLMNFESDADAPWVARLAAASLSRAESAISEAAQERTLFRHLEREHHAEGRLHYVEIDAPFEIYALVRLLRPVHVVEVGVSSGVSSAYILKALERNDRGTLHSIDLPKAEIKRGGGPARASWSIPSGRASGWAVPFHLRARWDLRLGDKRNVIPLLVKELPRIDLFLYDVPHNDARDWIEFQTVDHRMRRGGVAIADHGPGGGLCGALHRWSLRRSATPAGRQGLGLYGFRLGSLRGDA